MLSTKYANPIQCAEELCDSFCALQTTAYIASGQLSPLSHYLLAATHKQYETLEECDPGDKSVTAHQEKRNVLPFHGSHFLSPVNSSTSSSTAKTGESAYIASLLQKSSRPKITEVSEPHGQIV
jgi:hypothetical protein